MRLFNNKKNSKKIFEPFIFVRKKFLTTRLKRKKIYFKKAIFLVFMFKQKLLQKRSLIGANGNKKFKKKHKNYAFL